MSDQLAKFENNCPLSLIKVIIFSACYQGRGGRNPSLKDIPVGEALDLKKDKDVSRKSD